MNWIDVTDMCYKKKNETKKRTTQCSILWRIIGDHAIFGQPYDWVNTASFNFYICIDSFHMMSG